MQRRESETGDRGGAVPWRLTPLPGAGFGGVMEFPGMTAAGAVAALEARPDALEAAVCESGGILLLPGMEGISEEPALMLRLSQLLGPEVEDYRKSYSLDNRKWLFDLHEEVPEIIRITNLPPINSQPSPLPDPPLTAEGLVPVRYPHRRGWHTDQSFRRPPPDYSLFYAHQPVPQGQGQTLYCDATAAYEALDQEMKARIRDLEGIHVLPATGRSDAAVLKGEPVKPLASHQQPQPQPLVRRHPVTGKPSLYLCDGGQMDFLSGPIAGLEAGPEGAGAALLYRLLEHMTQRRFTYTHEWNRGDLVIYDNRNLLHAGTWYDAEAHIRIMWRTTVRGNPDPTYEGQDYSWVPDADFQAG